MYYDLFEGAGDVIREFGAPADALDNATVHFAKYVDEYYSGNALVIFERAGKLYEVNGSHCSCYGLEGQWEPEETSWQAIAIRDAWPEVIQIAKRFLPMAMTDWAFREDICRIFQVSPRQLGIIEQDRAGKV